MFVISNVKLDFSTDGVVQIVVASIELLSRLIDTSNIISPGVYDAVLTYLVNFLTNSDEK